MSIVDQNAGHLMETYSAYPHGRFVSLLLLRHVESEAMFRTEGSGEPLNKEFVFGGERAGDAELIQRVVISKRKQTAVERRMGREMLREHNLLRMTTPKDRKSAQICALNTNNPCEKCVDCMVYGYAAGGGGSQRSRVITDDAFSLHPAATILGTRQFNGLFEDSTMSNPADKSDLSKSLGTDEYVKPETVFLDIETLKDVTPDEFRYIVGNVLRSSRYGAISSRIGKVRNSLVGVAWSNCELFSNLEWVQHTYELLRGDEREPMFPLHITEIAQAARTAAESLRNRVVGRVEWLTGDDLGGLVEELGDLYGSPEQLSAMLTRLASGYPKR